MSSMMCDLVEGKIDTKVANAACSAGGKLLKVVEMEHKYGRPQRSGPHRLALATL